MVRRIWSSESSITFSPIVELRAKAFFDARNPTKDKDERGYLAPGFLPEIVVLRAPDDAKGELLKQPPRLAISPPSKSGNLSGLRAER